MSVPFDRFRLARQEPPARPAEVTADPAAMMPPSATRRVSKGGKIGFGAVLYFVGARWAGESVEVVCDGGLVQIHHCGVLIATRARRHDPKKQKASMDRAPAGKTKTERPSASSVLVTRKVDSGGKVCFAAAYYPVGLAYKRRQVQVAVVNGYVEISIGEHLIRKHVVRHDRTREHGALANPGGRVNRKNAAA